MDSCGDLLWKVFTKFVLEWRLSSNWNRGFNIKTYSATKLIFLIAGLNWPQNLLTNINFVISCALIIEQINFKNVWDSVSYNSTSSLWLRLLFKFIAANLQWNTSFFKKNGQTPAPLRLFSLVSIKHHNFYNKLMWQMSI